MASASVVVAAFVLLASIWHLHQAPPPESSEARRLRTVDTDFRNALKSLNPQLLENGALELGPGSALSRVASTAKALDDYLAKHRDLFVSDEEIAPLRTYLSSIETELSRAIGPGLAQRDGEAAIREIFERCNRRARASPTWTERVAARDVIAAIKRLPAMSASVTQLEWSGISEEADRLQRARTSLEVIASRPGLGAGFCISSSQLARIAIASEAGRSVNALREAAVDHLGAVPSSPAIVTPGVMERLRVRGAFPYGFLLAAAVLIVGVFLVLMLVFRLRDLRRAVADELANVSASLSSMGRFTEESLDNIRERLSNTSSAVESLRGRIKAFGLVSWDLSAAGALQRTQGPLAREAQMLGELVRHLRDDFHGGEDNERIGYRISELSAAIDSLFESIGTFERSLTMFREASVSGETAQRVEIDRWREDLESVLSSLRSDVKLLEGRLQSLSSRRA